jgi:type IV pilus assembly protein PilC
MGASGIFSEYISFAIELLFRNSRIRYMKPSTSISTAEIMRHLPNGKKVTAVAWPRNNQKLSSAPLFSRIKSQEVTQVVRQLATLIQMRLPLDYALTTVEEQADNKRLKAILGECRGKIEQGAAFAEALGVYKKYFPDSVTKYIAVGELTGRLGDTLDQAATQLEKMARLRRKLLTALSYPAVVLCVAAGAITFLLLVVVPTFSEIFKEFGAEMPAATRMLIAAANLLVSRWYFIVLACYGIVAGLRKMWKSPSTRIKMEILLCRMPILGSILLKSQLGRFLRTLGTLLKNGISLTTALPISGDTSGSLRIACSSIGITEKVKRGISLHSALQSESFYPPLLSQMARVGEESGTLAEMMEKAAEYYEQEIDAAIEVLNAVIEPVIIVGLGLVLGTILVAMYLQIFSVVDIVQ